MSRSDAGREDPFLLAAFSLDGLTHIKTGIAMRSENWLDWKGDNPRSRGKRGSLGHVAVIPQSKAMAISQASHVLMDNNIAEAWRQPR
jgi:hypothetical protein